MPDIVRADLSNSLHAHALIELMSLYACDPMGGGVDLSDEVKVGLAAALHQRSDVRIVLAFDGDQAVGLANCFEGFSTFLCKPLLNIHDIIVRPGYRGQGISHQLLQEVENIASETGCCKLTLEVLEGNDVAQSAYKKFGFRPYELDPHMGNAVFWEKKL